MTANLSTKYPWLDSDIVFYAGPATTWTAQPAALTELFGEQTRRRTRNLTRYTRWRLEVGLGSVSGFAGSKLGVQFSPDGGANWYALDSNTLNAQSTTTLPIDFTNNTYDTLPSTSVPPATGAVHTNARINDCLLRIVGSGGNGVVSPTFEEVILVVNQSA